MQVTELNSAALMLWALDAGELAASSEDRAAVLRDPRRARWARMAAHNDTRAAVAYGRDAVGGTL